VKMRQGDNIPCSLSRDDEEPAYNHPDAIPLEVISHSHELSSKLDYRYNLIDPQNGFTWWRTFGSPRTDISILKLKDKQNSSYFFPSPKEERYHTAWPNRIYWIL